MSVGEQYAPRPREEALDLSGALWRLRRWAAPRQGRLGLGGLLLALLVFVLSADQTHQLLPQSVQLGLPRSMPALAGELGRHGVDLGWGGVIMIVGAMFFAYLAAVLASEQLSARAVLLGIVAANVIVLLGPPLISTDVFSYIAYGRLGTVYHANPYLYGPSAIALDPLYPLIGAQWVSTPTVYGPLFTGLSYLLTPLGIAAGVLAYRGIAAVCCLVVVAVVWQAARLRGVDQVKAVALVGLNPIVLVYGVGGGHNDLLMLALLVVGMYALMVRWQRTGGVMIVLAAAVKLTAGLLLPFALARDAGAEGRPARRALLGGFALAALAALAFSFAEFGTGPLHLLGTLEGIQQQGGAHSIPGLVLIVLGLRGAVGPVEQLLGAAAIVYIAWLVRRVWRAELEWILAAGWATLALLLTAGLLLPWYVTWLLPLAAIGRDRRLIVASFLLTALCLTTV
jgi:hypothetical protein